MAFELFFYLSISKPLEIVLHDFSGGFEAAKTTVKSCPSSVFTAHPHQIAKGLVYVDDMSFSSVRRIPSTEFSTPNGKTNRLSRKACPTPMRSRCAPANGRPGSEGLEVVRRVSVKGVALNRKMPMTLGAVSNRHCISEAEGREISPIGITIIGLAFGWVLPEA